jgi:hypothetical protein
LPAEITLGGLGQLPKVAAVTFAVGAAVYFDATADNVTSISTRGNKLIGAATQCAGASDAVAIVRLTESVCERFHPVFSMVRANFGAQHGKRAPQSRHAERVP